MIFFPNYLNANLNLFPLDFLISLMKLALFYTSCILYSAPYPILPTSCACLRPISKTVSNAAFSLLLPFLLFHFSFTFSPTNLFFGEREVIPIPKCFLEVKWGPAAAQPALFQEGDAVTQHFGLVQVVRWQNDCPGLKIQRTTKNEKWKFGSRDIFIYRQG